MKLRRRTQFIFLSGLTVIALIAIACGSSPEPTPTATAIPTAIPTSTPSPVPTTLDEADLTQTQVFEGFGFSIDYPAGWTATEGPGGSTQLNELQEESSALAQPPNSERKGYLVTFDRVTLDFLRTAGLPDDPTLDDLLSLNSRSFGWEILDTSSISAFDVPALSVTLDSILGSGIAVLGIVDDQAFLLSLIAPAGREVGEFLPTWTRMVESIKPASEAAPSVEDRYFEDVGNALSLTAARLGRFSILFTETYETRQRLIDSLLEAGVGTAFINTTEALQAIVPPDQHASNHQSLIEHYLEMVALDGKAAEYVADGDVAGFVLINGQLGQVSATFGASLPLDFCQAISGLGSPVCASEFPSGLGDYETRLGQIFTTSRPQVLRLIGTLGFPLSLTPEEIARVITALAPDITTMLTGLQTQVTELSPPEELTSDHERLAEYTDQLADEFEKLVLVAETGGMRISPGPLQRILEVSCPTATSFSSLEFIRLLGTHFSDMGCSPP